MRRGGQRIFRAAQAFCPELSLQTWTGASNEDEYGNYVQTPLNTQAMSFKSVCKKRENVAQNAHFWSYFFFCRRLRIFNGIFATFVNFSLWMRICTVLLVHVCREHCLQTSSTRGQVVLFGNLRYRGSHPGGLVHVWFRAAKFVVALAVREPKQINAACAQLWFSLNAPPNHHLDSLTGVWKHSSHMVP